MNQHANQLRTTTRGALGLALLASLCGTGAAEAACQGGRFLVQDAPLVAADFGPSPDAVVVLGSSVSIESGCAQVRGRVRVVRGRTKVLANWASCREPRRKVLLRAEIDEDCQMAGALVMKRPRSTRRFHATRSFCGDGLFDADAESCDDGNQIAGDGCETDCTISPAPPTTSSTTTTSTSSTTTTTEPPPPCPFPPPLCDDDVPPPPTGTDEPPDGTDLPPVGVDLPPDGTDSPPSDSDPPPGIHLPPDCPPELC